MSAAPSIATTAWLCTFPAVKLKRDRPFNCKMWHVATATLAGVRIPLARKRSSLRCGVLEVSKCTSSFLNRFCLQFDDVRFYNYALSAADVKTLACGDKADIDCGLWAHYTFEQHSHDVSGAGWHPKLNEAAQGEPVFAAGGDVPQGNYALFLDGKGTRCDVAVLC